MAETYYRGRAWAICHPMLALQNWWYGRPFDFDVDTFWAETRHG
ncbi:MAG: hypothetical protein WBF51_04130 [Candidatus Dormiibacterota bacterium]